MQRDAYLATFFWILVVLWMAFIFYCSAQPATQSKDLSSGLTDFVVQAMNRWLPAIKVNTECLHGFLRKLAHFLIYLLLGVLVMQAMRASGITGKRAIVASLLTCVLYAVSDELHQFFVPNRGAQITDVILDSFGSSLGIFLASVGWRVGGRSERKKV